MVRKLLASTALATLLMGAAYAQDATQPAPAPMTEQAPAEAPVAKADGFLASNLIGETVYNGTGDDAENIGNVNDVVVGADGQIEAVVIGVGGFLGLGEKNVAINYGDIDWAERNGDRWIVVEATKEQLEAQAEFDRRPYDPTPAADTTAMAPAPTDSTTAAPAPSENMTAAPEAPADDTMAHAPADDTAAAPAAPADETAQAPADTTATPPSDDMAAAPAAPADETAQAPATATDTTKTGAIDKSTLTEMPSGDIRAEDLVGTVVYGANDANLGEIGDVVLTQDGKVDAVIVDVGGFLGVGEKEVAIGMDNLAFMTDKDGNKYLYTTFSKEQLDAAAAYDKSTWAEKRDDQRIIVR